MAFIASLNLREMVGYNSFKLNKHEVCIRKITVYLVFFILFISEICKVLPCFYPLIVFVFILTQKHYLYNLVFGVVELESCLVGGEGMPV